MLDLKNCPFCGGKATFAKTTKGWKVECEGRWGTCTINARTHYQPTKGQAVDAWNRRAIQAVGPEPAVAVKPLKWRGSEGVWHKADAEFGGHYRITQYVGMQKPYKLETHGWWVGSPCGHYELLDEAKAAAEADYASRIRSALLATPPAERVVEAPQPANSVRGAAERVVSFDWSSNDPDAVAAVDALRAALATKPAVKDDETVVEALDASGAVDAVTKAVAELQRRVDAGEYVIATLITNLKTGNCPPEKAVEWFETEGRAALAAKDGRS